MSQTSTTPAPAAQTVLRGYVAYLDPTPAQEQAYLRHAGTARKAYNFAIAQKIAALEEWQRAVVMATYDPKAPRDPDEALAWARSTIKVPSPTAYTLAPLFRQTYPWYRESNTYAFANGLRDADAAWKNWLTGRTKTHGRRAGFPRFHRRGRDRDSFTLSNSGRLRLIGHRRLYLPALTGGPVRVAGNLRRLARRLAKGGVIVSVTLTRYGSRWRVSVLARETLTLPTAPNRHQKAGGPVGVDLGVKTLATLSTGQAIANPTGGRRAATKLRKAQQALARTKWVRISDGALVDKPNGPNTRPSNGRLAAQRRVADLHAHLTERRHQTLHRLTKKLAADHDLIAIEDLNVAGMTHSARGTLEHPGRNVRAKAGLNREILDVSFGEFRRQLTYKTQWYGSELAVIDRYTPTSKTCATCGWQNPRQTLAQRTLTCPRCGPVDRDLNAARNILAAARGQFPPVAPENEETKNARREEPPSEPAPVGAKGTSMKREGRAPDRGRVTAARPTCRPSHPTRKTRTRA